MPSCDFLFDGAERHEIQRSHFWWVTSLTNSSNLSAPTGGNMVVHSILNYRFAVGHWHVLPKMNCSCHTTFNTPLNNVICDWAFCQCSKLFSLFFYFPMAMHTSCTCASFHVAASLAFFQIRYCPHPVSGCSILSFITDLSVLSVSKTVLSLPSRNMRPSCEHVRVRVN